MKNNRLNTKNSVSMGKTRLSRESSFDFGPDHKESSSSK
jgi:hypothetical protein